MEKNAKKGGWRAVLTPANLVGLFRLCLIPTIVHLQMRDADPLATAGLIVVSALAGILVGRRMRRESVPERARFLEPVADKLTQAALLLCLAPRYRWPIVLALLFALREVTVGAMGYVTMHRTHSVGNAKWYARAAGIVLYACMTALILFEQAPDWVENLLFGACAAAIVGSWLMYWRFYRTLLSERAPRMRPGRTLHLALTALLVCAWLALIALCVRHRDQLTIENLLERRPQSSFLAALLLLGLFAFKSVTVVLYGSLLYAAGGILFDLPVALLVNLLGTVVMVTLPYLIGQRAGAQRVRQLLASHPRAQALQRLQTDNDLFFAFLSRMIGFVPSDLLAAYMGATGVAYLPYLAGSVLGLLPSILTFTIMGVHVQDVRSPQFLISMGVQAALTVLSVALYIPLRRKHRAAEEDDKP